MSSIFRMGTVPSACAARRPAYLWMLQFPIAKWNKGMAGQQTRVTKNSAAVTLTLKRLAGVVVNTATKNLGPRMNPPGFGT